MSNEYTARAESLTELYAAMNLIAGHANRGIVTGPVEIVVRRPEQKRSNDQNAKLWACLSDVASQVEWYGRYLSKDAWKDIFSAALERQDVVPGLEGGFVMIGGRTSKMSKKKFADLLTLIDAFGAERNITWSDPALAVLDEYREVA